MDMTNFVDVDVKDENSVRAFLSQNAFSHQAIHNALLEQGIVVSSSPMFWEKIDQDFLNVHQEEHLAWAQALGLNLGTDFASVDPSDQKQMQDWLAHHSDVTVIVAQTLGLQVT